MVTLAIPARITVTKAVKNKTGELHRRGAGAGELDLGLGNITLGRFEILTRSTGKRRSEIRRTPS
jgi:hypothetical protein